VGYDWKDDEIITGGRDQSMVFVMDGTTGALKVSFNAHGTVSVPRGTTVTTRQTMWEGDYASGNMTHWEVDYGHGSVPDTLIPDAWSISEGNGGTINYTLNAGNANAGRNYLLLGSMSGITPGTPLPGGEILPINFGMFTIVVITLINGPIFNNFMGYLDGMGMATAQFNALGPLPPGLAGAHLYFAYALNKPWDFVSDPEIVLILP
jgi:hypothetical protein